MARIQIVPLPTQKVGEFEETPFILVVDKVDYPVYVDGAALKESTGARAVILWDGELDAPGALEIMPEAAQTLISRFTV